MKLWFSKKRDITSRMDSQIKKYYEDLEVKNAVLEKEVIYLELNYKKSQLMALLSSDQNAEKKNPKRTTSKKGSKENTKRMVEDIPVTDINNVQE